MSRRLPGELRCSRPDRATVSAKDARLLRTPDWRRGVSRPSMFVGSAAQRSENKIETRVIGFMGRAISTRAGKTGGGLRSPFPARHPDDMRWENEKTTSQGIHLSDEILALIPDEDAVNDCLRYQQVLIEATGASARKKIARANLVNRKVKKDENKKTLSMTIPITLAVRDACTALKAQQAEVAGRIEVLCSSCPNPGRRSTRQVAWECALQGEDKNHFGSRQPSI